MKAKNLFGIGMLLSAAVLAGCSSDDMIETGESAGATPMVHFTTTIGEKSETTRALDERENGTIEAKWTLDDVFALVIDGTVIEASVTSVGPDGKSATLEGEIPGDSDGKDIKLVYPYSSVDTNTGNVKSGLLMEQDGTLEGIAKDFDVTTATSTISIKEGEATLATRAQFKNEFAICKFTFKDAETDRTPIIESVYMVNVRNVTTNTDMAAAVLDENADAVYIAMPSIHEDTPDKDELEFTVVTDDKLYKGNINARIVPSNYYQVGILVNYENDEFIDFGFESGVVWAYRNLGAEHEWEYGDYYAWGEIGPKTIYIWDNYKWGTYGNMTKYYTGTYENLLPEDDAAYYKTKGRWRMPTQDEWNELCRATDCEWQENYKGTGINGLLLILKADRSKTLFFPAAGRYDYLDDLEGDGKGYWVDRANEDGSYWASTDYLYDKNYAWGFGFYEGHRELVDENDDPGNGGNIEFNRPRCCGLSIRPVRDIIKK